jgi:hypothetical protein
MASIRESLSDAFKSSPPETPPPGGMTFEQRAALIGALYELTRRDRRSLRTWQLDLARTLSYADATGPLAEEARKDIDGERDEEKEKRLSEIARTGLHLAEAHPIAAFGGDVRHLVAQISLQTPNTRRYRNLNCAGDKEEH